MTQQTNIEADGGHDNDDLFIETHGGFEIAMLLQAEGGTVERFIESHTAIAKDMLEDFPDGIGDEIQYGELDWGYIYNIFIERLNALSGDILSKDG